MQFENHRFIDNSIEENLCVVLVSIGYQLKDHLLPMRIGRLSPLIYRARIADGSTYII